MGDEDELCAPSPIMVVINGETHQRSQATQEVMQLEVHECGAHQTNQESSDPRGYATRSIHSLQSMPSYGTRLYGLGDSDYSYMSKAQITPNDVADATAVCSRDSLKLSRKNLQS